MNSDLHTESSNNPKRANDAPLPAAHYPNLLSRLLVKPVFERQFGLPEAPPAFVEHFLRTWERHILRIDVEGIPVDRPIFLVGLPRSGTTLVQDLLCSMPMVGYFTNTMNSFRHCFCAAEAFRRTLRLNVEGERYIGDSVRVSATSPNDGVAFWGELFRQGLSLDYKRQCFEDLDSKDIAAFRMSIRKALWCQPGCTRFFCKLLGVFPHLPTVCALFPDARYIHVVRDPRMVANSMIKLYRRDREQQERHRHRLRRTLPDGQVFVPYPRFPRLAEYAQRYGLEDVRTTAGLWRDAMAFLDEVRPSIPAFHEVRYEDILADPRGEIVRILEFCELPVPTQEDVGFWKQLERVGRIDHVNRYADYDIVSSICTDAMLRFGYR